MGADEAQTTMKRLRGHRTYRIQVDEWEEIEPMVIVV
jgi:hypothetical protein